MIFLNSPATIIKITEVDDRVLTGRYHSRCMECGHCVDDCCSFGCPADLLEIERIMTYREDIEKRVSIPAEEWFGEIEPSEGFPSEKIRRTRVVNGKCVFLSNGSRGCHLHALALEMGLDPHDIKPLICFLFPLTWEGTMLYVSEFLGELPCREMGMPVLEAQADEIKRYLGEAVFEEIRQIGNASVQAASVSA